MRIAHLSTHDIVGGAARAAYRLHQALRHEPHESRLVVLHKTSDDPSVERAPLSDAPSSRVRRRLKRWFIQRDFRAYRSTRPEGLEPFSDARAEPAAAAVLRQVADADVLNAHWTAGLLDLPAFLKLSRKPLVWTLHDMNPLTGGCHYSGGCDKFTRACGACPQLGSAREDDLSRATWRRKAAAGRAAAPIHWVAPSAWMAAVAARSSLRRDAPISVIPNGVDADVFRRRPVDDLREAIGIPQDRRVAMFVAGDIGHPRKGFRELCEALQHEAVRRQLFVLFVGAGMPRAELPFAHAHLGAIDSELLLATIYSLADFLLLPSAEDNLPNTALEALACGTPVVAFDVGGVGDVVRSGETGLAVPPRDAAALTAAMLTLLRDPALLRSMGERGRDLVVREFTLARQARRYLGLYADMLRSKATESVA